MKISYTTVAKILIILGIVIFLATLISGFIVSCDLWKTDKSHTDVSMLEFAFERLANECKVPFVLGAIPTTVGIVMLLLKRGEK